MQDWMKPATQSAATTEAIRKVPTEIYIPLVDSLYKDGRTLFSGTIFIVGSVLVTYWKTGEPLLLLSAFLFAFVAFARGLSMRAYARARATIKTDEAARRWEYRYVVGAATSVLLLGIWCYIAFALTNDAFAQLVSFTMTIAYVIGIFGRNFGSARFVIVQILCAWIPITAALILHGDIYHWIFAALLIPFFMAVKFIAERLRRTLLDAVIATRDVTLLATRFDTALTNMPNGLCMFDRDGRVAVSNGKLNLLLGFPAARELRGMTRRQLVEALVAGDMLSEINARRLLKDLDARLSGEGVESFDIDLQNGRTLEFTFQLMENGGIVLLVEDITERKIAEAKISHMARFDALTGLPNRMVLHDRMNEALVECGPRQFSALHFIDLDQFKQVNDTLGHSRGDILLQAVADRLRSIVRKTDVVSRFGGDEFVVLQSPIESSEEAAELAKRILASLGRIYQIDGHEVVISASIGIALSPMDGTEVDQVLRNADMALYRAKAESRGAWRFFEPEMDSDAQARRSLELDLRNAIENDAFEVYYQPLVNLKSKRIVACEALVRWPHPERGMISPAEFIPVAEEMGLIVDLGRRVLHIACQECKRWPNNISVAVNLSPIQFSRANIPALVCETLGNTGLTPNRLEIEITETLLLQDTRRTRLALEQLQALGVRVSLDDFGTGYSSLSYLHSFPLHKVKIDQSFLNDVAANSRMLTLLRGMARLSAELGLRVAVEGVETQEQLALLEAEGTIDEVQGYLFGRPVSSTEIRKLLYAAPQARIEQVA
jgi:diguanylate cyclase (GGDEF)-like protein